jgi:hypothetical protein
MPCALQPLRVNFLCGRRSKPSCLPVPLFLSPLLYNGQHSEKPEWRWGQSRIGAPRKDSIYSMGQQGALTVC